MSRYYLLFVVILLNGSGLTGCTTPVPVASHSLRCEVSAELLKSECAQPTAISEDATFAAVVDTMRADRQALLECRSRMVALRDSIIRCNRQADSYNQKVDEINNTSRDRSD